jgi:hypothetical protein
MESPSRAITKEGPPGVRLAFYHAANVARTRDQQLAAFYRRLMVELGHCHTKANCAVARKLVARTLKRAVAPHAQHAEEHSADCCGHDRGANRACSCDGVVCDVVGIEQA